MKRCAISYAPAPQPRRCSNKARQHLSRFLLRHGKIYSGVRTWTQAYRRWLTTVRFDHPGQLDVLQDYIDAVITAEQQVARLTRQIMELTPTWSMAPVATAIQAMRGAALINAVTIVAEVGDFARIGNARQLMAYLGLVPSEHSSGIRVRRGGITKAGNVQARRALIEGDWTCRMQARVSLKVHDCLDRKISATSPGRRKCSRPRLPPVVPDTIYKRSGEKIPFSLRAVALARRGALRTRECLSAASRRPGPRGDRRLLHRQGPQRLREIQRHW
jgi:Transposase IS116/IS110/IS902 family